jgi:hypothetical protein
MAALNKKDGSPYWYAWYQDAAGKQHSKSTGIPREPAEPAHAQSNEEAARKIGEEYERCAKAGLPVDGPGGAPAAVAGIPSYQEFTGFWIVGIGGDKKYHDKVTGYLDNIGQFLQKKIEWPICGLHAPDFAGIKPVLLAKGYSPTTVTAHLKLLRQVFLAAIDQGFALDCPIGPADYIANPSPNRPTPFSVPQVEWLANATKIIDWRTAILLGFYCGMELSEASTLLWDTVNFVTKRISWTTFTRRGNPIITEMPLHPVLERHLLALKNTSSSLCVTPSLLAMSGTASRAHFRKLIAKSKLPSPSISTKLHGNYHQLQFGSIKLTFAREVGHAGLYRLARFLHQLSPTEFEAKITGLPHLQLKPIPLLGPNEPTP